MSAGDMRIVSPSGRMLPTLPFVVKQGVAAINPGEPVKILPAGVGQYYVVPLADADGTVRSMYFVGIAAKASTQTSSADGSVEVYLDQPGTIYALKAKTTAAADTQAEIDSRLFYRLVIDLTSSKYTLDDPAADSQLNAFIVMPGGDPRISEFFFVIADQATWRWWAGTTA